MGDQQTPVLILTTTPPTWILQLWMTLRITWWQHSEMIRTLVMSNLLASGAFLITQLPVQWFAMLFWPASPISAQSMLVVWSLRPLQCERQVMEVCVSSTVSSLNENKFNDRRLPQYLHTY